jgi:hypothetical protein
MLFTDWLLKQDYRDDMIGDLAKDCSMDINRPKNGIIVWRTHLRAMRANDLAFLALERAYEEYKISKLLRITKNMN